MRISFESLTTFSLRLVLIMTLLAPVVSGFSQVNSFSDQYLANLFLLNPAIAGTGQYGTLVANSRQQWSGWDGAPASQSVTYHTKWVPAKSRFTPQGFINKGKYTYSNVGVGGGFFHDSYGVFHLTGLHLDYSYHLYLNKGRLSFGLSPTFFQVGSSRIVLADPQDPYLNNPNKSFFIDFNAGVHYFNKEGYAGFSLIQLANSSVKFGNYGFPGTEKPSLNPDLARSAYAYGGYFFTLNRSMNLKIEPMALIKLNQRNGFLFDVSTTVHLRDMFNAGVSYRLKEDFSVFVGVRLDNLSFRYLFAIPVSADIPKGFSSHMIQLGINIGQPIN
ncbi:MAG: PorP/SprF family type IX secretion system membrane protein [Bacteroidia bacterium]|nr:PorP/SprF family type IX secretion system membrane protein [Bacteroidia bacterium]